MERESMIALCQFELVGENGKKHHYKCKFCNFEIDSPFPPAQVRRVCDAVKLTPDPNPDPDPKTQTLVAPRRKPCNCGHNRQQFLDQLRRDALERLNPPSQ